MMGLLKNFYILNDNYSRKPSLIKKCEAKCQKKQKQQSKPQP